MVGGRGTVMVPPHKYSALLQYLDKHDVQYEVRATDVQQYVIFIIVTFIDYGCVRLTIEK